jgi:hypothetical protein
VRVLTNTAPSISSQIGDVTAAEDAAPVTIDLSNTFADLDIANGNDDFLRLRIVTNTNSSLVQPTLAGNRLTLNFGSDQNGVADITVEAVDQGGLTVSDTFRVTVTPVNDAPVVANPVMPVQVPEDSAPVVIDISNVFFDVDTVTNNDQLSFRVLANDQPTLLTATASGSQVTLTFVPDQNGQANITIEAQDTANATRTNTFVVTVNPVNDNPRTVADTGTTNEDTLLAAVHDQHAVQ